MNTTQKIISLSGLLALALLTLSLVKPKETPKNEDLKASAVQTSDTGGPLVSKFDSTTKESVKDFIGETELQACLSDSEITQKITSESKFSDAKGTPLIYLTSKNINYEVQGALPYEYFVSIIESIKKNKDFPIPDEAKPYISKITDSTMLQALAINTSDALRGNQNGSIGIIEYSDISCPFCKKVHLTLKKVIADIPETFWIYRHHPIISLHPLALEQAIASECVKKNKGVDAFWLALDNLIKE